MEKHEEPEGEPELPGEVPRASPEDATVADDSETREVRFEWDGKLHVVEVRRSPWGRMKEARRGSKIHTYQADLPGEDGELVKRTVTIADLHQGDSLTERVFKAHVVAYNGRPWAPTQGMTQFEDGWVQEFMRAFRPRYASPLEDARKK